LRIALQKMPNLLHSKARAKLVELRGSAST
jgi:hypothetical protein